MSYTFSHAHPYNAVREWHMGDFNSEDNKQHTTNVNVHATQTLYKHSNWQDQHENHLKTFIRQLSNRTINENKEDWRE